MRSVAARNGTGGTFGKIQVEHSTELHPAGLANEELARMRDGQPKEPKKAYG